MSPVDKGITLLEINCPLNVIITLLEITFSVAMPSVDKGITLLEITFSGQLSSVDKGSNNVIPLSTDDIAR